MGIINDIISDPENYDSRVVDKIKRAIEDKLITVSDYYFIAEMNSVSTKQYFRNDNILKILEECFSAYNRYHFAVFLRSKYDYFKPFNKCQMHPRTSICTVIYIHATEYWVPLCFIDPRIRHVNGIEVHVTKHLPWIVEKFIICTIYAENISKRTNTYEKKALYKASRMRLENVKGELCILRN